MGSPAPWVRGVYRESTHYIAWGRTRAMHWLLHTTRQLQTVQWQRAPCPSYFHQPGPLACRFFAENISCSASGPNNFCHGVLPMLPGKACAAVVISWCTQVHVTGYQMDLLLTWLGRFSLWASIRLFRKSPQTDASRQLPITASPFGVLVKNSINHLRQS